MPPGWEKDKPHKDDKPAKPDKKAAALHHTEVTAKKDLKTSATEELLVVNAPLHAHSHKKHAA